MSVHYQNESTHEPNCRKGMTKMMSAASAAIAKMATVAENPNSYVGEWKARTGRKAVGAFPMNFPAEVAHAAGALPVIIQENREPITLGRNLMSEFYCGYTRSIADQSAKGHLAIYDGFFLADHCIQLLGAVDVVRDEEPDTPMYFGQLMSSLGDAWTTKQVTLMMQSFVEEMRLFTGAPLTDEDLSASARLFNEDRQLLRALFTARREGRLALTASDIQACVKSSMIMEKADHVALMRQVVESASTNDVRSGKVRIHLSGHFCHAPRTELLQVIEDCGAVIVDDDLYHGARYISTDVAEVGDPVDAITRWYLERDINQPCPTRVKHEVNWEDRLLESVEAAGADAVIVLMAKFCEPHMLYYPELRKAMNARGVPHLLIETEHEGLPEESIRTRVEALVERVRRRESVGV
jgi:benzoyl-CoA reductase/2-hydroxyglutaryl-CoA dehydratase subunit BcrC/BadD/HgdB